MASSDDVKITVSVDASGAVRAFDQLGKEIESVRVINEKTDRGFSSFQATLVSIQAGVSLAKDAFLVLKEAVAGSFDALEKGSQIDDVASAFNNLSKKAGTTAEILGEQLKQATGETISDFDLMKKANEAMLAGIKPQAFVILNQAARQFAEEGGTDMRQELEALTFALQTGSDRALKAKGIFIDNEGALKEYADTVGISAKMATESQKAEAQRLAILKALMPVAEQSTQITADAGDKVAILKTSWKNATDQLLKEVAANDAVNSLLDETVRLVKSLDLKKLASEVGDVAKAMTGMLSGGGAFNTGLRVIGEISGKDVWEGFKKSFMNSLKGDKQLQSERLAGLSGILGNDNSMWDNIWEGPIKRVAELTKNFKLLQEKVVDTKGAFIGFVGPIREVAEQNARTGISAEDLIRKIKGMKDTSEEAAKAASEMADGYKESAAQMKKAFEDEMQWRDENPIAAWMDDMFGDATKQSRDLSQQLASEIQKTLTEVISLAMDKSATGKEWREMVAGIGSLVGSAIVGYLSNGNPAAMAVGGAIGEGIGKVIFDAFGGGDTGGTKARKAIDKYFAELFDGDRLGIIVNGQLQRVSDLVISGMSEFGGDNSVGTPGFFAFLETLPQDVQAAFEGVGNAFTMLLGQWDDFGTQLGAALANNIGGSLNNLQLLIQATGKSAEELNGAIVKAFLEGKLSASEANQALVGIHKTLEKGIPDGLGLVVEAWNNFEASTTKGGAAMIDAIKDIAYEAKELGIKDFPALIAYLKQKMPEAADSIDQMFAALSNSGIDSIDKLTSATDEQLIPSLAQLEDQKFPFAEAAKDANELINQVNELPDEIRKKIIVDVETRDPGGVMPVLTNKNSTGPSEGPTYRG